MRVSRLRSKQHQCHNMYAYCIGEFCVIATNILHFVVSTVLLYSPYTGYGKVDAAKKFMK